MTHPYCFYWTLFIYIWSSISLLSSLPPSLPHQTPGINNALFSISFSSFFENFSLYHLLVFPADTVKFTVTHTHIHTTQ